MPKYLFVPAFIFLCSCRLYEQKAHPAEIPLPPSAAMAAGYCSIEGQVIGIDQAPGTDTGSMCSKYSCMARVKIVEVYACGSAVAVPLAPGDVADMKFAYTLHNTEKIFPRMKTVYPGLKTGDFFTADVQQRLSVGSGGSFVICGYELVR